MDTLIFMLVSLIAVDSARGTCVFNSEFGFNLTCGFRKTSLFRVRNLGGVKGYVGLGFSVGDELGFPQALSTTEDQDKRRSTNENDILRTAAMSTGRSQSGRSPQLSWSGLTAGLPGGPAGLPGTAGAVVGTQGVVPPFRPLGGVTKEAAVPPFSALPPSIARIPVINGRPQAPVQPPPMILQASLQQMANRRYQVSPPSGAGSDLSLKNSIVVGSVEPVAPPAALPPAPPAPRPYSFKPKPESFASKTKRLQDALHHPDTGSPSPLLMGHSVESLAKASNISADVIAAALRLREQQLIASLTSTAPTTTTTTTTTTTSTTTPRPTKPATVRPRYPLVGPNRVMNAPKEYYPVSYDQNYDDNFTSKVELPDTSFSCGDQKHFPGLYADEDLGCMTGPQWWNHPPQKQELIPGGETWKRQAMPYSPEQGLDPDAMRVASKQAELQSLLQQIYQAEAAVKMETGEVTRTQQVAAEAEQGLEEAANKVRLLSSDLQAAQEAAAQAAMKAHTSQLQLSAHDQLMFTARQRVDALSAQMVSVQAELASAQQLFTLTNSSQHLEAQAKSFQLPFGQDLVEAAGLVPDPYGPQGYLQDGGGVPGRWQAPIQPPFPPYYPQNYLPPLDNPQRPYYIYN